MIFGGAGSFVYELELLHNPPSKERGGGGGEKDGGGQRWLPLEVAHGTCSADECSNDLFAVRHGCRATVFGEMQIVLYKGFVRK